MHFIVDNNQFMNTKDEKKDKKESLKEKSAPQHHHRHQQQHPFPVYRVQSGEGEGGKTYRRIINYLIVYFGHHQVEC